MIGLLIKPGCCLLRVSKNINLMRNHYLNAIILSSVPPTHNFHYGYYTITLPIVVIKYNLI